MGRLAGLISKWKRNRKEILFKLLWIGQTKGAFSVEEYKNTWVSLFFYSITRRSKTHIKRTASLWFKWFDLIWVFTVFLRIIFPFFSWRRKKHNPKSFFSIIIICIVLFCVCIDFAATASRFNHRIYMSILINSNINIDFV